MKNYSICLFLLLFLSSNNFAATFFQKDNQQAHNKAEKAMSIGNFAIAYCLWEPLASQGDSKAQFNIGWMFHNGYGLTIDDTAAFTWWIKAAEQGYVDAFYTLADLYLAGFGVDKDKDIAMGWYIAAAELDHEASLEIIHNLINRTDKRSKKYFSRLLYDDWYLHMAQKGDQTSLNILLSLANKRDNRSQQYFSRLLKENRALFIHKMRVKVARANIRRGPGTQFKIVTSLKQNDELVTLSTNGKWTQVGLFKSGKVAWVFSGLLEPISQNKTHQEK